MLNDVDEVATKCELNRLLPPSSLETSKNLSSSAPCAIASNIQGNNMLANGSPNDEFISSGGGVDIEVG